MTPPEGQAAAIDPHGRPPVLPSLPESFRSVDVPAGAPFWRKMLAFGGPGYLVAVGYMDPGNWATGIAGGAQFGYTLLAAVLLSNFIAIFLQALSLRLGVAGGLDLAQACRARFGPRVNFLLWLAAEVAIIATDLAEVIGTAVALKLLFGLPLSVGVCLTALDAFLILALQRFGFRYLEAFVIALVAIVGLCFGVELLLARPEIAAVAAGFVPSTEIVTDPAMLYIALGIFGATVMPHNLYLHSAIAQTRRYEPTEAGRREAIKFGTLDSTIALMLALAINSSIVILAASAFHFTGNRDVADLEEAHRLLAPLFGTAIASVLFAVALLASGQNSTVTGTMAGQIVMEGFLGLRMHPALRRLLTRGVALIPALFVVFLVGEGGVFDLLVLSQVVLSLQLGFAVIPLIMFTSDRRIMGPFVNGRAVAAGGYALSAAIVAVNAWLVLQTFLG